MANQALLVHDSLRTKEDFYNYWKNSFTGNLNRRLIDIPFTFRNVLNSRERTAIEQLIEERKNLYIKF